MKNCPCGSEKPYSECCEVFISGAKVPSTAEELMRSRYSAYHQRNFEYIMRTMKSPAADLFDIEDAKKSSDTIRWTRLEVIKSTYDTVEFRAHYRIGSEHAEMHEKSRFEFENGKWYYVDGALTTE
jgi:SEC-C motif-containing protein